MNDLVVIAFPTEATAEEVRQKLLAMQKEYLIERGDVVIAVKRCSRPHQTQPATQHSTSQRCFAPNHRARLGLR
jgi:uncharacterized membrane protein